MSKKDIIIISALINTGLLAVLFVTAMKTDTDTVAEVLKFEKPAFAIEKTSPSLAEIALGETRREEPSNTSMDEVDLVLKEYLPEMVESAPIVTSVPNAAPPRIKEEPILSDHYVDVVVKSGDALEKIARANRTTVEAIRKANGLQNDRLKIGQKLKVPIGAPAAPEVKKTQPVAAADEGPTFYVVKSGDNPWKIAKQYQVKFEDLLTLNNLDEERAKNLKVGEKIRVR